MRRSRSILFLLIFTIPLLAQSGQSNSGRSKWKKQETEENQPLQIFQSTMVINLNTSEAMQPGDFEFEISHRFMPVIDEGIEELYGLDGPANIRFALGYTPLKHLMITFGRSNYDNQWDLALKYAFARIRSKSTPLEFALRGGAGLNTFIGDRDHFTSENWQFYGQLIANTRFWQDLGAGVVASYLYNNDIFSEQRTSITSLGGMLQYNFLDTWAFMVEYNGALSDLPTGRHDSIAFGFELNTGGHFFKLFATNNPWINSSQYLGGADRQISLKDLRLGFVITRAL